MNETELHSRLGELFEVLTALPSAKTAKAPQKDSYLPHTPAKSSDEMMDFIRLRAKYLVFDLEATRRENRYLREMLERRSSFGEGSDPS